MEMYAGSILGLGLTRQHVLSARPDAPVVPERPPRAQPAPGHTRRAMASMLRRFANRLEPGRHRSALLR